MPTPKTGVLEFVNTDRIAGGVSPGAVDLDFYGPTFFGGPASNQKMSNLEAELGDCHLDIGKSYGIRRIRITYWSIFDGGLVSQLTLTRDQFLLINLNFKSVIAQTPAASVKWTFANETARKADGVFTDSDKYKVAYQTNEKSWWVLVNHTLSTEDPLLRTPVWESQDLRSQIVSAMVAWRPVLFFLPTGNSGAHKAYIDVHSGFFPIPSANLRNAKDQRILYSNANNDSRATGMVRFDGSLEFFLTYSGRLNVRGKGNLPFVVGTNAINAIYEEIRDAILAQAGPFEQTDIGRIGILQEYSIYLGGAVYYTLTSLAGDWEATFEQERLISIEFLNTD